MKARGVAVLGVLAAALALFGAALWLRPGPAERPVSAPAATAAPPAAPSSKPPPAPEAPRRDEAAAALAREVRQAVERAETGKLPALLRGLKSLGPAGRRALEAEAAGARAPLVKQQLLEAMDLLR